MPLHEKQTSCDSSHQVSFTGDRWQPSLLAGLQTERELAAFFRYYYPILVLMCCMGLRLAYRTSVYRPTTIAYAFFGTDERELTVSFRCNTIPIAHADLSTDVIYGPMRITSMPYAYLIG
eukprot:1317961-Rhodomonas_salina.1